jgi:hypothetical protein
MHLRSGKLPHMRRFVSHAPGVLVAPISSSLKIFNSIRSGSFRDAFCMARWNPLKNTAVAVIDRRQILFERTASRLKSKLFRIENWNRSMKFLFK